MSTLTVESLFSDIISQENIMPDEVADPFTTVATTSSGRSVTMDLVQAYLSVVAERDALQREITALKRLQSYWIGEVTRQATTPRGQVPPPIPPPAITPTLDVEAACSPMEAAWDAALSELPEVQGELIEPEPDEAERF